MGNSSTKQSRDLAPFRARNLPFFWVIGPPLCGKSTLAEMLANSSNYRLISVSMVLDDEAKKDHVRGKLVSEYLSKRLEVPDEIVLKILKEIILATYQTSLGYIVDGFPKKRKQAQRFKKEICNVGLIIYVTLVLDALLARVVKNYGAVDLEAMRIRHIKASKNLNAIYKSNEHKAIKVMANYPPEDTCTKLIEDLEDFWGYKFQRCTTS